MSSQQQQALAEILAQHDALRVIMDRCDELADELDATSTSPVVLVQYVAQLREAFETHNRVEERTLPSILATGALPLERHTHEHRTIHGRLATGVTGELRETIAALRAHLDTEERYFRHR